MLRKPKTLALKITMRWLYKANPKVKQTLAQARYLTNTNISSWVVVKTMKLQWLLVCLFFHKWKLWTFKLNLATYWEKFLLDKQYFKFFSTKSQKQCCCGCLFGWYWSTDEPWPDLTWAYFWPAIKKEPTQLQPGYLFDQIRWYFFLPKSKKIRIFGGKFSRPSPQSFQEILSVFYFLQY